jgi:diaminopimelate epimerase
VPELVEQPIRAAGRDLCLSGVSVGNPHCVVFRNSDSEWTRDDLLELGPALEGHEIPATHERPACGGDRLEVAVDAQFDLTLDGEVAEVARGRLSSAFLRTLA